MAPEAESSPVGDKVSSEAIDQVRTYHHYTKHRPERPAPGPGYLDWENQPDPFRRFSGAPLIELPLITDDDTPPYDALFHTDDLAPRSLSPETLGLFLELSLGISAWKGYQNTRWALRCNPSSGNLHPTEGYIVLADNDGWLNGDGVYHYAPKEHALEQRCSLNATASDLLSEILPTGGFLVGLTSIHWREAWKYGERAYRYCQHDIGHALGSLSVAAAALGWQVVALPTFSDNDVSGLLGIDRPDDFPSDETEHPALVVAVSTSPDGEIAEQIPDAFLEKVRASDWTGIASQLSSEQVEWRAISIVEQAAGKPPGASDRKPASFTISSDAPPVFRPELSSAGIIRQRRSAVAMDGQTGLSFEAFQVMLARTLPEHIHSPWNQTVFEPRVNLCLFVHRVQGLSPGLYVLMRDRARFDAFRSACSEQFEWTPVEMDGLSFFALDLGDYRPLATHISCTQEIAGDGAFSLGMMADFTRTLEEEGAWSYRRLFWEAGLIGQSLYLEAEAAGVRATGIGCFFDDAFHHLLGLDPASDEWQSLYHFTVGGAIDDTRLTTLPAYHHLPSTTSRKTDP